MYLYMYVCTYVCMCVRMYVCYKVWMGYESLVQYFKIVLAGHRTLIPVKVTR